MSKKLLLKKVWNKKPHYYKLGSHSAKQFKSQLSYKILERNQVAPVSILEFGCGDGHVINSLGKLMKSAKRLVGFDISSLAIKEAKKKYPKISFFVSDAEKVNKKVGQFDLVSSFFTFEHLDDPEKVLSQMVKYTNIGGYLYIICPNYGSPIFPSPCFKGSLTTRLINGLRRDIKLLPARKIKKLMWEKVSPIIDESYFHICDYDTTVEPYIYSLEKYVKSNYKNFNVVASTSGWETVRLPNVSKKYWLFSLPFQIASMFNISPFKHWGPACVLLAKRIN